MVAIVLVVIALILAILALPRLVAVLEDRCWEGRIVRSRQLYPVVMTTTEEVVQFADLPLDVQAQWHSAHANTQELPTVQWAESSRAFTRQLEEAEALVASCSAFIQGFEGQAVGAQVEEAERCFKCYTLVKERGDGLCDECWEAEKAADRQMWADYYRQGGTDECQMVSDFAPSVKALGGGRIEVNGLFILTPADGAFYWEALDLICEDEEETRPYRGSLCAERITIQRVMQAVGRIGQQVMGAIVGLARTVARACGFNPRWDATPINRCGSTRGAACNDTRPVTLKSEWKKAAGVRLAALHRETMLGANLFAPPCVMSAEEMAEDLPSFVPMSRGPKGRAKSRRDGDPGVVVVVTNRLGKQLQYREGVVVCKATHANGRERDLKVSRKNARKAKAFVASL